MHPRTLLIALSMSMSLFATGCARQSGPPGQTGEADEDGESCAAANHGNKVYIEVTYDGSGKPSVTPEECTVAKGSAIVWRTARDVDTVFEIDFEGESAAGPNAPRRTKSQQDNARQKLRMTADNAIDRRYKYAIEANGQRVDPAVIIKR